MTTLSPWMRWVLWSALFPCTLSCGGDVVGDFEQFYATEIISFEPGPGAGFGQDQLPDIVLGAPDGKGPEAGGLDVLSLGQGGTITLGFGDSIIVDEPGPDLLIFENAFWVGGDETNVFAELGMVEVSEDGQTWFEFPCDISTRQGCAGWHPPLPFDPAIATPPSHELCGGDPFDLAELGLSSVRYIRITDVGQNSTSPSAGFDLDAIAIIHRSSLN